ncbi:scavenger receptor cysteine-rich domain-containing group B protein-like [Sebastes fasciatus]|uniref:scavenger receptor cysteine-rich domain-containing group B protein-like n=2 Tax=Sebastes fasciatus TaxID=394691 RepID=UPI003D9F1918
MAALVSVSPQVRLADCKHRCSGRVEIFHLDRWGTVCDDLWNLNDAQVVCRQMGCGRVLAAPGNAYFGQGTGQIWLDDLRCTGNESSLTDCPHLGLGNHNCLHFEDASVICEEILPVRLVNSNTPCSGRVEVLQHGHWGTVCDNYWNLNDAHVVCRQLGCGRALSTLGNAYFGQGTGPIWLADLHCTGNEASLTHCQHPGFGKHYCHHAEDAGVICEATPTTTTPTTTTPTTTTPTTTTQTTTTPTTTTPTTTPIATHPYTAPYPAVRLVNSNSSCSGRVEIYHHYRWGTVCDNYWDLNDAHVVCQQLGCGRALSALGNAYFGQGTGPIWLADLHCTGNEASLTHCQHPGFANHYCHHAEDAGVICTAPYPAVRLVNSNSSCSGRVEIYHHYRWGTVCDNYWDLNDAHVVCRQLGCGRALSALGNAYFGQGTGPIWLADLHCTGNEASLTHCQHPGFGKHYCHHAEDAGVICEVRLVNSNSSCSGRVEIYRHYNWGTVCDNYWDLNDAHVVCRQLGCGRALSALGNAYFGQGTGPIWLADLHCTGNEASLTNCTHRGLGYHYCHHAEDAGVICEGQQPLIQASQLVCSPYKIEVGVPLQSLLSAGLNAFSGHLATPYCTSYTVRDNIVWYQVLRRTGFCGTVMTTNTTHAIYSNSLFFYPLSNGSFSLPSIIPFSCAYPLETETSLNAVIKPQILKGGLTGSGTKARAYMNLFRDSNYSYSYPAGPLSLPVGSALHVQVSVPLSDPSFAVVLEECYTTNSSNPDDPVQYFLIHSRCSTDSHRVSVVENGLSYRARFSALLFPLHGDNPSVFIHCRLRLCDKRSHNCVPICRRRTYRSADTDKEDFATIGPINFH